MPDSTAQDMEEIVIPVRLHTTRMEADMRRMQQLSQRFADTLARSFTDAVFSGRKLSDVLRNLMLSLARLTLHSALRGVFGAIGNAAATALSGITPFARGGVVQAPTLFAAAGGIGLMGEAGPEAIMPLARGPGGRLGVRASGGAPVTITMNITTPDAESFSRNRGRIAAELTRAMTEGQRNL